MCNSSSSSAGEPRNATRLARKQAAVQLDIILDIAWTTKLSFQEPA